MTRVTIVTCNVFSHHTVQDVACSLLQCPGQPAAELWLERLCRRLTGWHHLVLCTAAAPCSTAGPSATAAGSREQREGSLRATQESERTLGQLNNIALDLLFLDETTSFLGSSSVLWLWLWLDFFEWLKNKSVQKSSGHGLVLLWQCTRQRGWIRSQILNNQFRERERESWINVLCCDGIFSFIQLQFL